MKSFTDIEQSNKLIEILPVESADMWYWEWPTASFYNNYEHPMFHKGEDIRNVPCWSLAALLDYISANFNTGIKYLDNYWELDCKVQVTYAKELVAACVEMILKLKEKGLL